MPDKVTQENFWDCTNDVRAGMLSVGNKHPVPMSHYVDRDRNALWFITAKQTDSAQSAAGGNSATYTLADAKAGIYAHVHGKAQIDLDRDKLKEIWNTIADAWFEDGKEDPDLTMIRMDLDSAEVWINANSAKFLYEIAKAEITDDKPDAGARGTINF